MLLQELVFILCGNLEFYDLVTAWRTCRGTFHYMASCSTDVCKKENLMCLTLYWHVLFVPENRHWWQFWQRIKVNWKIFKICCIFWENEIYGSFCGSGNNWQQCTHMLTPLSKTHTQTQVMLLRNTLEWWNWDAETSDPIKKIVWGYQRHMKDDYLCGSD
jgi:hypothetical protein